MFEANILKRALDKHMIQAWDINDLFVGQDNAIISRQIKKLIDKKMLSPEKEGARKYLIRFYNNYLLRGNTDQRFHQKGQRILQSSIFFHWPYLVFWCCLSANDIKICTLVFFNGKSALHFVNNVVNSIIVIIAWWKI